MSGEKEGVAKTCSRCSELKSLDQYGKWSKSPDGRQAQCIPCRRESRKSSDAAYRERNREGVRKRAAEWARNDRQADPEKSRAAARAWRQANVDKARAQSRESERRRRREKPQEVRAVTQRAYLKASERAKAAAFRSGRWTAEEDALILTGHTATEVAYVLGRTLESVMGRRQYLRDRDKILAHQREREHREASMTLPLAHNHRKEWTGPELETIARYELTALQAALMLGRTAAAVEAQRTLLRREPTKARLAGLPTDLARIAEP